MKNWLSLSLLQLTGIILLFSGALDHSAAQTVQDWVVTYNGPGNGQDKAVALVVDGWGNVYVTGYSIGSGTGYDYATIKYNPEGNSEWEARYNGAANGWDQASALTLDDSGNVYVTGQSDRGSGNFDFATVKYTPDGRESWVARYNGPGDALDSACALVVDGVGNVYVTGSSDGGTLTGTYMDFATLKYNSTGQQQWVARFNGLGVWMDYAVGIGLDSAGYVYVAGYSTVNLWEEDTDYTTIKYNPDGQEQWVMRYDGPAEAGDVARALVMDPRGNVYVTGSSADSTSADFATVKYNSAGVEQWVMRYNGPENGTDEANSITLDSSGNVYIAGYSSGANNAFDYATIKYNSAGNVDWVSRFEGTGLGNDIPRGIAVDPLGNVFVAGESDNQGGAYENVDYCTVKYNSLGQQKWVAYFDGPGVGSDDDRATALALDGAGSVFITGESWVDENYYDYTTIKYHQVGNVNVVLSPPNPPTVIPSTGGTLNFNIAVINNYDSLMVCDVWCEVIMPDSSVIGPVLGPLNLTLPIGFSGDRDRTQSVPGTAPPGVYLYKAYVGLYPDSIFGEDYLVIVKVLQNDGEEGAIIRDWENSGESFTLLENSSSTKELLSGSPTDFRVSVHPNPFNATTTLSFNLTEPGWVNLKVFDVMGRSVLSPSRTWLGIGANQITFNGADLPSGIYLYRFQTTEGIINGKMVLLK